MNSRIAPRTAVRSSTRRSQGLRPLVMGARKYYGSPPKTIRKFVYFCVELASKLPRGTSVRSGRKNLQQVVFGQATKGSLCAAFGYPQLSADHCPESPAAA